MTFTPKPSTGALFKNRWQRIETAPLAGTAVKVTAKLLQEWPVYPITARYLDGQWKAEFDGGEWRPYEPQPAFWNAMLPARGDPEEVS